MVAAKHLRMRLGSLRRSSRSDRLGVVEVGEQDVGGLKVDFQEGTRKEGTNTEPAECQKWFGRLHGQRQVDLLIVEMCQR